LAGLVGEPPRTALYRLYNTADVLLYVGVSDKPLVRWAQHAAEKTWWSEVAKLTLDWHDTRELALEAELRAIGTEHPRHNSPRWNVSNTPGPTPRQAFRIDRELLDEFRDAVGRADPPADMSAVVRQFMSWYVRQRGAKLPRRPERPASK
jgi:hypothetical protein